MAVTITEYLRPRTVREAANLLALHGREAMPVAGGVSIVLSGSPRPIRAIDLSNLGLDRIERRADTLRIGAMTTFQTLIRSKESTAPWNGLIPEACRTAATTPVRDMITVGGNIVQCYYWSTLPPLLLALDAKIVLAGPERTRTVPAAQFFDSHPRMLLAAGEIVTRVDLPLLTPKSSGRGKAPPRQGAAYLKFAKTHNDYAMVNACAVVSVSEGTLRDIRLALGALDTLPHRCRSAETALQGKLFDPDRARDACLAAAETAAIREDLRASARYRRHIAAVTLFRALETAFRRATSTP